MLVKAAAIKKATMIARKMDDTWPRLPWVIMATVANNARSINTSQRYDIKLLSLNFGYFAANIIMKIKLRPDQEIARTGKSCTLKYPMNKDTSESSHEETRHSNAQEKKLLFTHDGIWPTWK